MFNDMNSDDDAQSEDLDDDTSTQSGEGDTGDSQRLGGGCSYRSSAVLCLFGAVQAQFPGKPLQTPSRHAERAMDDPCVWAHVQRSPAARGRSRDSPSRVSTRSKGAYRGDRTAGPMLGGKSTNLEFIQSTTG